MKRVLFWMLVAMVLVIAFSVYHAYGPKPRFNVAPDAEREIEKAMRR